MNKIETTVILKCDISIGNIFGLIEYQDATEKISWQMPTFWQGENLIHFAAFKKHIGLYPGGEATSEFAERLTGYKTSKGGIQLPLGKPIDHELITDIVRWRIKQKA